MSLDWVKARAACSIAVVFKELELGAREDVDSFHEAAPNDRTLAVVTSEKGNRFSVTRSGDTQLSVDFALTGGRITATDARRPKWSVNATLTLNDAGECRLLVDGKELEQWQFRRKALESLFFGESGNRAGGPRSGSIA